MKKVNDTVSEFMKFFGRVQTDPILYDDHLGMTLAIDAEDFLRSFCDFLEQRQETRPHETIVIGAAADEWQTGEPEESGRYLVEYQQGERIKKVFVMDYDAFEERWITHATEAEVLRWARINSEYQ